MIRTGKGDPIAYTYEADYHCPDCAAKRFGVDEHGSIPEGARDNEGNPIGAVAPWDEWYSGDDEAVTSLYCGTCGTVIDTYEEGA